MLLGAMTWFFIAWGLLCAVAAATPSRAANAGMCSTILLAISGGLPFLVPAKFSSVLLGAGSSPFLIWLAQLSYRDVRNAIHHAAYPHLHWIAHRHRRGAAASPAGLPASGSSPRPSAVSSAGDIRWPTSIGWSAGRGETPGRGEIQPADGSGSSDPLRATGCFTLPGFLDRRRALGPDRGRGR